MEIARIVSEIDAQIAKLQQARALLSGPDATPVAKKKVGRPRKVVADAPASKKASKRSLSPEARKRIADAQKRRWAERNKTSAGKSSS